MKVVLTLKRSSLFQLGIIDGIMTAAPVMTRMNTTTSTAPQ
jgi:hypothetical protein